MCAFATFEGEDLARCPDEGAKKKFSLKGAKDFIDEFLERRSPCKWDTEIGRDENGNLFEMYKLTYKDDKYPIEIRKFSSGKGELRGSFYKIVRPGRNYKEGQNFGSDLDGAMKYLEGRAKLWFDRRMERGVFEEERAVA